MRSDLKAFTIMEVSVVLVLVGIITSIIFKGVAMFNEQLSNDAKLKQEISEFYIFRANLYQDLFDAEEFSQNELGINLSGVNEVHYGASTDGLIREVKNQNAVFAYKVNELSLKKVESDTCFYLNIDWKENEMELTFPIVQNKAKNINNYFKNFDRKGIK